MQLNSLWTPWDVVSVQMTAHEPFARVPGADEFQPGGDGICS